MSARAEVRAVRVDSHDGHQLSAASGEWSATVLWSLGMVVCSLRHQGHELLAGRGGVSAYAERGSTFGIPLLHPWANRLGAWGYAVAGRRVTLDPGTPHLRVDGDTGLPIHGLLAANAYWKVSDAGADADAGTALVRAELDFAAHRDLLEAFPFPHRLELEMHLGEEGLSVTLTLTATGEVAVPRCFGFHPYLAFTGADRDACEISLPVRRRLLLDDRGLPTGGRQAVALGALDGPLGERRFDDCFDELQGPRPRFTLTTPARETAITFQEGFGAAQVFSPPDSDFICFEPMASPVNALVSGDGLSCVAPGDSAAAGFAISSRAR
jgi:aldose 1-epimerase